MSGKRFTGLLAGGLLSALVALAWVPAQGEGPVKDKAPPEKVKLPADLARVPRQAIGFVSVRVADLLGSEIARGVRKGMKKEVDEVGRAFEKEVGLPLEAVERLTFVFVEPRDQGPLLLVATVKPFDRAKVLKATAPGGEDKKYEGHTIHVSGDGKKATYLVGKSAFMTGPTPVVQTALEKPGKPGEGLSPALDVAAGKHGLVAGMNPGPIAREVGEGIPPGGEPFEPLLKTRWAVLTADVGEEVKVDLRATFGKPAEAREGAKALWAAKKVAEGFIERGIKELARQKEMAPALALVRKAQASLRDAAIKDAGPVVLASARVKVDSATFGTVFLQSVQKVREAAARTRDANNLKQIGIAVHNYHSTMKGLPPRAVFGKDGKPLLSWRVLILPYIEQDALYREFRLNEPWDSPHNKKLLKLMPKVYAAPLGKAPPGHTFYQVFHGKNAFFEGKRGLRFADISDGLSNTLMVVEADKAVPWTKPDDLPYDPKKPIPRVGGVFGGGFNALFGDGSVRYFRKAPKESIFRLLIERNDGMPLPTNFDE